MVEPGDRSAGETDSFTCTQFSVQRGDGPEVTILSLQGFSYQVDKQLLDDTRVDEQGQLYGIPDAQFEDLIDSTGEKLPFEAPVLYTYTDMAELLLLDPIHDVDETGWPKPASEENS